MNDVQHVSVESIGKILVVNHDVAEPIRVRDALNPVQFSKTIRFNHFFDFWKWNVIHHIKHKTVLHVFYENQHE